MKIPTSWIKELLCRTMSDTQIVDALERAGLEVEQFSSSKSLDKNIVVALVKNVVQHPKADRLKLVNVTTDKGEVRIVCGAANVREGLKVALAQVGTTLPDGDVIEAAKLRGELSEGMLCSARELGLGDDHDGIMELADDLKVGTALCDIYPADGIVGLKTHANRFDLLSVTGLAREVAAMTDNTLTPLPGSLTGVGHKGPEVSAKPAMRFMLGRLSTGHNPQSPDWMTAKLRVAGVRSISAIVDITNYVNLELGQPLHAYDADKVALPMAVRHAKSGEKLVTLDGVERILTPEDLVIADASGPIGLAGVMGGSSTQVGPETKNILLEAATFDGAVVRKMAKRHGLRTEASARFERQLPVELPPLAIARAVQLLEELSDAKLEGLTDAQHEGGADTRRVELTWEMLRRLLGFDVTPDEAAQALNKLEIPATVSRDGKIIVVEALPWWRPDIKESQDLIEEIVRVIGLERVPATLPAWQPQSIGFDMHLSKQRQLRQVLYGAGLFEVMTYSFVSEDQLNELGYDTASHLKLKNPMSIEQAYLRSSLLPSHLTVLERNRVYAKQLVFYELSKIFQKQADGEQPNEPLHLGITVLRPTASYRQLKGILDALSVSLNVDMAVVPDEASSPYLPGRSGRILLAGNDAGRIGQLDVSALRHHKIHGEVAYLELDADVLLAAVRPREFAGMSRFPSTHRDLAVILPAETTWAAVREALTHLHGVAVSFVSDYYGGDVAEGSKSMALRLTVSHVDRTPTEAEVADAEQKALAILKRAFGARVRV